MPLRRIRRHGAHFVSYFLAFALLKGSVWIGAKFGSPTLDQIIFHLQNGTDGLADADPEVFRSFVIHVGALPLLFAVILFSIQQVANSQIVSQFIRRTLGQPSDASRFNCLLARVGFAFQWGFSKFIPIGLLLVAGVVMANQVALVRYLKNQEESTFFAENYRVPESQHISAPQHQLNLVLIYVESLEKGYEDAQVMGSDLLAPLQSATARGAHFDHFLQVSGTGWTIAGIVSSQCGIPLKSISLFSMDALKEKIKSFLPGATCLGDVLEQHGYKNIFMGGASLYFADKGKFLSQHGYSELYGKEEWVRAGAKKFGDWGLYDDELFKRAKTRLDQLQQNKQPFNLTLLTVDTHPPVGYISPTCASQGVKDYKGVVTCTSGLIADFIQYMQQKGYLKNTVVVIMGDHLSNKAPLDAALKAMPERSVYNAFLSPRVLDKNRDTLYHFDVFPSALYAMGFRFDNNRLGLGRSGFGPFESKYGVSEPDVEEYSALLDKNSSRYLELWQP